MKIIVTETQSLLEAMAKLAPDSTKTTLRSWIKEGRAFVDNVPITNASTPVHQGQEVTIGVRPRFAPGNLRILYEDHHLVVIEKPSGLLSVAAPYEQGETAHGFLKARYRPGRVYPVHRLDQDTSGVMLFALSEKGQEGLKEIFEKHAISRQYVAVVEGQVKPLQGSWSSYQYEDANYYVHNSQDPSKGKLALTFYEVTGQNKQYTLLELRLETGRKNQIRAHCQMAGYSVAGDKKYGAKTDPAKRLCLHAQSLSFRHPVSGKQMTFEAPVPELFFKIVKPIQGRARDALP